LVFGSAHATAAERAAGAREVNRAFLTSVIDILEKYRPESRFKQISENFLAELDQHQAQEDATLNTKLSAIKLRWLVGERAAMKKKCIDSVLATISDVQVINGAFRFFSRSYAEGLLMSHSNGPANSRSHPA
jgi:hypothetical protein